MQLTSIVIVLILASVFTGIAALDEPEFVGPIRKCPKGTDEQLNECLKLIVQDLKPRLAAGVPEIQLPPLEPFDLQKLDFEQGSGAIVIRAKLTNVKVRHLSNFTDAEFLISSKEKLLNFTMRIPKLRIDGMYKLGGNILAFQIHGTGPFWFDLSDVHVHGNLKLKTEQQGDRKQVSVASVNMDLDIKDIKAELVNLFNGDPILGPAINNVLNENGQDLFQRIKPKVAKDVGDIVASIANAVISNLEFIGDSLD